MKHSLKLLSLVIMYPTEMPVATNGSDWSETEWPLKITMRVINDLEWPGEANLLGAWQPYLRCLGIVNGGEVST